MNYWIFIVTPAQGEAMLEYIEKVSPNARDKKLSDQNMIGKP
jgi:hypothetical protein